MGCDWGMSWGLGIGVLLMVLFWLFVIAGAAWLVMTLARPREAGGADRPTAGRTSHGILEERLARGEIDVEEFRARKAALGEDRR